MTPAEIKDLCILVGFVAIAVYVLVREWYDWKFRKAWNAQRNADVLVINKMLDTKAEWVTMTNDKIANLQNQFNEFEARINWSFSDLSSKVFGKGVCMIDYPLVEVVYDTRKELFGHIDRIDMTLKRYNDYDLKQENIVKQLGEDIRALKTSFDSDRWDLAETNRIVDEAKALGKQRGEKFDERLTHIESYLATPRSKRAPLLGEINVSEFMGIDPAKPGSERTVLYNNLTKRMEEF